MWSFMNTQLILQASNLTITLTSPLFSSSVFKNLNPNISSFYFSPCSVLIPSSRPECLVSISESLLLLVPWSCFSPSNSYIFHTVSHSCISKINIQLYYPPIDGTFLLLPTVLRYEGLSKSGPCSPCPASVLDIHSFTPPNSPLQPFLPSNLHSPLQIVHKHLSLDMPFSQPKTTSSFSSLLSRSKHPQPRCLFLQETFLSLPNPKRALPISSLRSPYFPFMTLYHAKEGLVWLPRGQGVCLLHST